ncbi:glycoside hydrolase family 2 [Hamadaea tsunoensis]|uniref:glycoside hydrolase family 2 n=1 Tax=Hamadaea tsunoensis TaxID=53368 RepID=UPI0004261EE1|nr:glycoside hydrolase family 2 [Hamadaea tsunoensis]
MRLVRNRSRLTAAVISLVTAVSTVLIGGSAARAAYVPKTPPLSTPWTSQVSTTNPLPEYPRPQLTRPDWQSLNGQWQFAHATSISSPPTGQTLGETILVPYPVESALSGIMRHENYMWYRRTFTVPSGWSGRRVQLNFGAVTWQAAVWVNGVSVGGHTGGYDSFSLDVTGALNGGTNEIIVGVYSPVDAAGIPLGKQRLNPSGIFYTASSGIWQSVWLEPTPAAHVTRLDTTPDVVAGQLDLVPQVSGSAQGVLAEVLSNGAVVGSATGTPGTHIRVPVPNARLWSPDDPFLYDLRVTLTGTGGGDVVGGYFGMRSIAKAVVNGFLRPVLNGRFVFQIGTLDQGYWPDGIYTAPTDTALAFDLQQQKALGFNTVRKHIKVEPARWYYWADKLGLLVWQDMPAMRTGVNPSTADRTNFESELHRMVDQLRGITSIVQWQPFNEGWGEYDSARIADLVKSWDPTRLVDNNSGSNCCGSDGGNGDTIDDHIYVGPGQTQLPTATRVAQLGEFGGLGLIVAGHEWQPGAGFGYEMEPDSATLTKRYAEVTDTLQGLVFSRGLSASIYTEPTDVENERNGFYTYDRQVLKMDAAQVRAANLGVQAAAGGLRPNTLISLGATTSCCTDRYLRQNPLGVTVPVSSTSDTATKQDSTFWLRAGLADSACYSFESRDYPGQYLRHSNYRLQRATNDGTSLFANDATFCARTGHTALGVSFESKNFPGRFIRHYNSEVYIAANGGTNTFDSATSWAADTTWQVASPWWRSAATLSTGSAVSLQAVTPCCTTRYVRHSGSLGYTEVVTAASDATLKADATWIVRAGLADSSCYSLESRNFPGQYLRHSQFRLRIDASDGTTTFAQDATFCAQPGRYTGADVTLTSYNIATRAIRHYASEVWIAAEGGPNPPYDSATSYPADVTWHIAAPWSP